MTFQTFQGDVDIVEIKLLPKSAKLLNTKTVMYGEATGHHHTFSGRQVLVYKPTEQDTLSRNGEDIPVQKYVVLSQDESLVHQEHATQIIPKGTYAILQEREWDVLENQITKVLD